MPTIKDIARAAGVSHGTVSNVLNKTGKVSAQKIRLVEEAAKKLGYIPNAQAQQLRQGAANHIAVIIPSLCDQRYRDLFLAVQSGLSCHGFHISAYNTEDIAANEEKIIAELPFSNLAAIITVSSLPARVQPAYQALTCPLIVVDRQLSFLPERTAYIGFDHYGNGNQIGDYIRGMGWQRVAFFCSSGSQTDDRLFLAGIKDTLKDSETTIERFSADAKLTINRSFDILHETPSFDGIVTIGDQRAGAVMAAMSVAPQAAHPQLVSMGASQIFPDPCIKTFEMDYGQMGAAIAEMLQSCFQEKNLLPQTTVLRSKGFGFHFTNIHRQKPQELQMLTLESPSTTALRKMLPMLEELTGITLKITCLPHSDLYSHMSILNERYSYDLIRMDTAWLNRLGSDIYMPLEDAGIADDILNRGLIRNMHGNYTHSNGIFCALPFDPSVQIFLYRSDLFQDATLSRLYYEKYRETLKVPGTIDEYLRISQFFTRKYNPDSPTKYGTTITSGSAHTAACDFLPYYLASGAPVCDENGTASLDSPDMHAAMEQYREMKNYTPPGENMWWRDSVRQFADGSTATAHTFSNHAAYIIDSKHSNVVGKTGVAVMPGGHPLLGGGVLGIGKYTHKVEACSQFFNWFYTKDVASAMVRLGSTSPLAEAFNSYENFSVFPWLAVEKNSFSVASRGCSRATNPQFSNYHFEYALGTAIRNILNQTMDPKEAAAFAKLLYTNKRI